jgi:hypothetical protein
MAPSGVPATGSEFSIVDGSVRHGPALEEGPGGGQLALVLE